MSQHLKGYQRSITLIKTGRLNKKNNTNINTAEKRKETGAETNISMCNSSASTNTSKIHIVSIVNPVYIHPVFYYSGWQINNNFNIFQKDCDAVLLERLLGRRFHSWVPLYLNIRCPNLVFTHVTASNLKYDWPEIPAVNLTKVLYSTGCYLPWLQSDRHVDLHDKKGRTCISQITVVSQANWPDN